VVERMPLHPKVQGLIPAAAADAGTIRDKMAKRLCVIGEEFVRNRHFYPIVNWAFLVIN
jgi:hypothetical protein